MEVTKRFMAFAAFLLLLLFGASARAQSDVRTPDQKVYFPQMDPVLTGMWMGHGDGDGMRFDPQAIACMVRACAEVQATIPQAARERCRGTNDDSCPYRQLRNGNHHLYQLCYAAHRARITQPGYQRLANPPNMTSLVCSVIAAQKESSDDAIYTAINGYPRPSPQAAPPPIAVSRNQRSRTALKPGEADQMMAELNGAAGSLAPPIAGKPSVARHHRSATASRPPIKPVGTPTVSTRRYGGLPGFRIVSQDDKETVLRILPGADYYTVERSFLAKDHETESVAVMAYEGNNRTQIFFPYRLRDRKIELYRPRLHLKADDIKGRLGGIDGATRAFMHGCDSGSCEARFALQAGETLRIPKKSVSPEAVSDAVDVPAAPAQPGKVADSLTDGPPISADATEPAAPIATMPVEIETVPISPTPSTSLEPPGAVTESPIAGPAENTATADPPPATSNVAVPETVNTSPPPAKTDDGVDIPFWAAIWTLGFGAIILAHRWYTIRRRKTPTHEDDEDAANAPVVQIIGLPEAKAADSAKVGDPKQAIQDPPPEPNGSQAEIFKPVAPQVVQNPKARVIVTVPGGIGPTEPTVLRLVPQQAQTSGASSPGDSGNAPGGLSPPKSTSGSS